MPKLKFRKDVALILLGAILAVMSFGINWTVSAAIDQKLFAIDEELHDIERYLMFAKSSVLEAFELKSSATVNIAISQLMYFQISKTEPEELLVKNYYMLLRNALKNQATAVTALHVATTGKTMGDDEGAKVIALSDSADHSRAILKLAVMFDKKMKQYQDVSKQKVSTHRKLTATKQQLESRRISVGHVARFCQLLGILIILAKDIVTSKQPDLNLRVEADPDASAEENSVQPFGKIAA